MTSMRRRYVASASFLCHIPAGNLAPPWPPQYSKPCPPPQYSKPSYAYENRLNGDGDPDEAAHDEPSHLVLYCLPSNLLILDMMDG